MITDALTNISVAMMERGMLPDALVRRGEHRAAGPVGVAVALDEE